MRGGREQLRPGFLELPDALEVAVDDIRPEMDLDAHFLAVDVDRLFNRPAVRIFRPFTGTVIELGPGELDFPIDLAKCLRGGVERLELVRLEVAGIQPVTLWLPAPAGVTRGELSFAAAVVAAAGRTLCGVVPAGVALPVFRSALWLIACNRLRASWG